MSSSLLGEPACLQSAQSAPPVPAVSVPGQDPHGGGLPDTTHSLCLSGQCA